MKNIFSNKWFLGAAALVFGAMAVSCEDQPDKFELTKGTPVVRYVRPASAAGADSLLAGAYLDNLVCLVGDNLTSIREMYFNDQKAILNPSYITDHTLVVAVPGGIPETVTNKIYMHSADGQVTDFDFNVYVPGPAVRSISCEHAPAGSVATIYGDYFIDDPNIPIKITMAGNVEVPYENITSISKAAVSFIVPENATPGYMNVTTLYGTGRSAYQFRDTRNILFDFDGSHGGLTTGHGWRAGMIHEPGQDAGIEAIDGSYLYFGGADIQNKIGGTWAEDQFSINYWPEPAAGYPTLSSIPSFAEMISTYGVDNLQLKFEVFVPESNPWASAGMQVIFTPTALVDFSNANNSYFSDTSLPRAIWLPWQSGPYTTGGSWQTIVLPLSSFNRTHEGQPAPRSLNPADLDGFSLFVWQGGVQGVAGSGGEDETCSPVFAIDNIRVVPVE